MSESLPDRRTEAEKRADAELAKTMKLDLTFAADRADKNSKTNALKSALNKPFAPGSRMSPNDPNR